MKIDIDSLPEFRYYFKCSWSKDMDNCLVIEAIDKSGVVNDASKDYHFSCELEKNEMTQKTIEWVNIALLELLMKIQLDNNSEVFVMKDLTNKVTIDF